MNERKIPFEIKMLDNMISRKICESVRKEKLGSISHVQADILRFLYKNRNKTIYQSDIEKEMKVRRSTISGILKTMEKNGFITKIDSVGDARKKEIILTDKTMEKHKEIEKKVASFEKRLLKGISCEQKKAFFNVIDKLKENLK